MREAQAGNWTTLHHGVNIPSLRSYLQAVTDIALKTQHCPCETQHIVHTQRQKALECRQSRHRLLTLVKAAQPVVINKTSKYHGHCCETLKGLESALLVLVLLQGIVYGVLRLYSDRNKPFRQDHASTHTQVHLPKHLPCESHQGSTQHMGSPS